MALLRAYPTAVNHKPAGSAISGQHGLEVTVSISPQTYARLLGLADQAPLECLPIASRTLAKAKTLGYNQIGQIRNTPPNRLVSDLGEERAEELQRALHDYGIR